MSEKTGQKYEFTDELLGKLAEGGLKEDDLLEMANKYSYEEMKHYVDGLLGKSSLDDVAGGMIRTR